MKKPIYSLGFSSQENEINLSGLPVEGTIPAWLNGSLIRAAPSKFETGTGHYRHWFDGLAMLHKFNFENRKLSYACKFLESKAYLEAREKGKIVYGEFGTDPCQDLFQRVVSFFRGPVATDNGCVNINHYAGELTATTESTKPVAFDLNSLKTKGRFQYVDDIPGQITIVHPHYDKDGTLFSYLTHFGYASKYNVYSQAPGSKERKLISSIPTKEPAYMHSIGMTKKYIILTEFPIVASALRFRFSSRPFIENYKWKPERGTQVHLIEKETGFVRSYQSEAYFAFHHVNAFEHNNDVIFDITAYENVEVIDQLYLHHLRSGKPVNAAGKLNRFVISLASNTISRQLICEAPIELPRINYAKVNAQPYQYVYGAGTTIAGNFLDNIIKVNVRNGQHAVWNNEYCYPGEPVFIENPTPDSEDDGILLSIVLDAKSKTSFLLILDAKNLQEIGRAPVPQHITFGFHGQFVKSVDPEQILETIHK